MKLKNLKVNRFYGYLAVQLVTVFCVQIFFKIWSDQIKIAAVLAGSLFCFFPMALFFYEYRLSGFRYKIWMASLFIFFGLFAVPMLSMRLLHWEEDFSQILIWGMSGPNFHKLSRWSFFAVISTTVVGIAQCNRDKKGEPPKN